MNAKKNDLKGIVPNDGTYLGTKNSPRDRP
jgi:hypothetical protein